MLVLVTVGMAERRPPLSRLPDSSGWGDVLKVVVLAVVEVAVEAVISIDAAAGVGVKEDEGAVLDRPIPVCPMEAKGARGDKEDILNRI